MSDSTTTLASGARPAPRPLGEHLRRVVLRPELTAVLGTLLVFAYFAISAGSTGFLTRTSAENALEVAAAVGIIAAPVTLLLIAREFDLSVGAMMGAGQIVFAYPLVYHGWPVWAAALLTVVMCGLVGAVNGLLVVKTRVPSFIITLGALFWIRGTAQGTTRSLTDGTTVPGVREADPSGFFASIFGGSIGGFSVAVVWFVAVVAVCAWVLSRTATGNRIFATGGNPDGARRSGVATDRLKVCLYVGTAVAAGLVGILSTYQINQGDVTAGGGLEFETVAAAVIGGAALSGGFGSPLGTAIGALLFGMVTAGFFFTNIPDAWYETFLGLILVVAVIVNERSRSFLLRPVRRST